MKYLPFFIFAVILSLPNSSLALQAGWRYPEKSDIAGAWAQHKDKLPEPYHLKADFNGDGITDDIWIMIKLNQKGWGLFAFISSKTGETVSLKIKEDLDEQPQERGILYIEPGSMQDTACGLGIPKCYPGDAYKLHVETPTFQMFRFKGGSLFYHWDTEKLNFNEDTIED